MGSVQQTSCQPRNSSLEWPFRSTSLEGSRRKGGQVPSSTSHQRRLIAHSGNINGFDAYSLRLPDSRIYLAFLMNHGNPEVGSGDFANQVAMLVPADGL